MGNFFGDDDKNDSANDEMRRTNELMQKQIADNDRKIETQRAALARDRIDLIKAQGGQSWGSGASPANAPADQRGGGM